VQRETVTGGKISALLRAVYSPAGIPSFQYRSGKWPDIPRTDQVLVPFHRCTPE